MMPSTCVPWVAVLSSVSNAATSPGVVYASSFLPLRVTKMAFTRLVPSVLRKAAWLGSRPLSNRPTITSLPVYEIPFSPSAAPVCRLSTPVFSRAISMYTRLLFPNSTAFTSSSDASSSVRLSGMPTMRMSPKSLYTSAPMASTASRVAPSFRVTIIVFMMSLAGAFCADVCVRYVSSINRPAPLIFDCASALPQTVVASNPKTSRFLFISSYIIFV